MTLNTGGGVAIGNSAYVIAAPPSRSVATNAVVSASVKPWQG